MSSSAAEPPPRAQQEGDLHEPDPSQPGTLDRRREHVMRLVRHASTGWADAMKAHKLAPPDAGFAARLRTLAEAAATEQVAWEQAHTTGLLWRPVPGAEKAEPPYELRPGTGRRGPPDLWDHFDLTVANLNHAITGSSAAAVAQAFGAMSAAAAELADAVALEDEASREAAARADEAARARQGSQHQSEHARASGAA